MPQLSKPPPYTFAGAPWSADDIRRRRESGVHPGPVKSTRTQDSQTWRPMPLPTPPITPNSMPPPPYEFAFTDPAWNIPTTSSRHSITTAPAANLQPNHPHLEPSRELLESLERVKTKLANLTSEYNSHPLFSMTWARQNGNLHGHRLQNFLLHTLASSYNLSLSTRLTEEDSYYFALVAGFLKAHYEHEDLCISTDELNPPFNEDHRRFAKNLWSDPIASFGYYPALWTHALEILETHGSRVGVMSIKDAHAAKLVKMAQLSRVDKYVERDGKLLEIIAPSGREGRWRKDFEASAMQATGRAKIAGNDLLNEALRDMASD
jgi:hypothetical protein